MTSFLFILTKVESKGWVFISISAFEKQEIDAYANSRDTTLFALAQGHKLFLIVTISHISTGQGQGRSALLHSCVRPWALAHWARQEAALSILLLSVN